MNIKVNSYKLSFFFIAIHICIWLAARDIVGFYDANDTGRYVKWIGAYCLSDSAYYTAHLGSWSYKVFYSTSTLGCSVTEPRVFLFIVSLYTVLPFFIFSQRGQSTFLWMLSFIISIYSFELMTNAMRQSLGLSLFLLSLGFLNINKFFSVFIALLAVLAHSSVAIYMPFLIGVLKINFIYKVINDKISAIICLFFSVIVIYMALNSGLLFDSVNFYKEIYQKSLSFSFLAYMVTPIFFVYFVRKKFDSEMLSYEEIFAFYYSLILIVVSAITFPAITYRIVFLSFPIYIYFVCNNRASTLSGGVAFLGMVMHSCVMFYMS